MTSGHSKRNCPMESRSFAPLLQRPGNAAHFAFI
jgi:hypothetical protein